MNDRAKIHELKMKYTVSTLFTSGETLINLFLGCRNLLSRTWEERLAMRVPIKKYLLMIPLAFVAMGLSLLRTAEAKGNPPEIIFSWAQSTIRQGDDWRIYISATDPDGDMTRIYCRVDQPGGQVYRSDMTNIKSGMEGHLSGYLVLRTYSSQDLFGTSFTLLVIIADRAGNESKPVSFPLTIDGDRMQPPPFDRFPPGALKQLNQRIGYIDINLMRTQSTGGGN